MAHMASLMPEQLSSPPLVELLGGLAHRHPVVPCAHDEACLRRRRRFHGGVIDRGRDGGHRVRAQQLDGFGHRRSPPTEMLGDHRVQPEDRRVHRDTVDVLEVRSQRTKARTSETTRIMPATLVSGSMFGYGGHAGRREPWPGWMGSAMLKPS